LQQFLVVERRDDLPGSPNLLYVRCAMLRLCNADKPNEIQGLLTGQADGPCLSLNGSDEKARVLLRVEAAGAECQFFGKDLKPAVNLSVDEAAGRGQMAVMEAGKPRAVLKAAETGGVVSVMHDDNLPRAFLHANALCGEFIAVNQDVKTSVKITSDGLHGGLMTVHGSDGKALVALSGAEVGGLVMVNDRQGKLRDSLPSAKREG